MDVYVRIFVYRHHAPSSINTRGISEYRTIVADTRREAGQVDTKLPLEA